MTKVALDNRVMKKSCHFFPMKALYIISSMISLVLFGGCDRDNPVDDDVLKSITIIGATETVAIDRGQIIELAFEVTPSSFELTTEHVKLINGGDELGLLGIESSGDGLYMAFVEDNDSGTPYSKEIAFSVRDTKHNLEESVVSNTVTVAFTPHEYGYSLLSNESVYDKGRHAAFTGLINYQGVLYLAFREGAAHRPSSVEDYGVIKILQNKGTGWIELATISDETKDLRDPFLIEMGGKLRVYIGYNTFEGDKYQHSGSVYADFENGKWSAVKPLYHDVPHIVWLWKVRKFKDLYYSVAYLEGEYPALLSSSDGINWETVTFFELDGELSEADMSFVGNTMYVCLRKDKPTGTPSFWGYAKYPFTDFVWTQMATCVESPTMLRLPYSEEILLAGRERQPSLGEVNVTLFSANKSGELTRVATLEPGTDGDHGYPGLVVKDGKIWCSYYTGTKQNAQIKLASFSFE